MINYDITSTPIFKKQLGRLCKKYPSLTEDINGLKESLLSDPLQGSALGNGLYKVRLVIGSKGQGKSGGARVITCVKVVENKIVMVAIYDKSEQETISIKHLLKLLEY